MVNVIDSSSLTCHGDCVCTLIMSCLVSRFAPSLQVLSVDWNKYNENVLVSGSVDRTLRVWVRLPVCIYVHMYACWCMLCACLCLLPACPCILFACLCVHPSHCTRACRLASRVRCLPCAAAPVLWCAVSSIHRCPLQLAAGPCVHRLPAVSTANTCLPTRSMYGLALLTCPRQGHSVSGAPPVRAEGAHVRGAKGEMLAARRVDRCVVFVRHVGVPLEL
jgi:hypothetical protein